MKLIISSIIMSGLVISGCLQADPKSFSPKVERVSKSEIYISFGRSLDSSAQIQVGPLLNPEGSNLKIKDIKKDDAEGGGLFSGLSIHLMPNHEMREKLDYALFIKEISDDLYKTKDQLIIVSKRSGSILTNESDRTEATAIYTSPLDNVGSHVEVQVKSQGESKPRKADTSNIAFSGAAGNTVVVNLEKPLQHKDSVSISAISIDGLEIVAKKDVKFKKPKNKDASLVYASLTHVANDGAGSTNKLDFKFDQRKQLELDNTWQGAWLINAETDSSGKSDIRKGNVSYLWTKSWIRLEDRKRNNMSIGPTLEIDDVTDNRNVLANVEYKPVMLSLYELSKGTAYLQPKFGLEIGKNLGLEKKLIEFEEYDVNRALAGFTYSRKWKKKDSRLEHITFTLDFIGRYLFSEETDTVDVPKALQTEESGKTKVVLDDGYKGYATATLALGLSEYFSIEFKYENGEKPMLFQDIDRYTIGFTYSY